MPSAARKKSPTVPEESPPRGPIRMYVTAMDHQSVFGLDYQWWNELQRRGAEPARTSCATRTPRKGSRECFEMRRDHLYLGKAGQLAVMAEIAVRNYNVAIPEVDVGDDIFVVGDLSGQLWRVQVKTARATVHRDGGLRAQFSVNRRQLERLYDPELYYSFVIRHADRWYAFVNVARPVLRATQLRSDARAGSEDGKLTFTLRCTSDSVLCGKVDLQPHRDDWDPWPVLRVA